MRDDERIGTRLGLRVKRLLFLSGKNSYTDSAKGPAVIKRWGSDGRH